MRSCTRTKQNVAAFPAFCLRVRVCVCDSLYKQKASMFAFKSQSDLFIATHAAEWRYYCQA